MKQSIYLFILIIYVNISYSQNFKVLDSITKEPFVAVKLGANDGLYTNENGEFQLDKQKYDSINIFSLGYHELKQSINKLNEIIYLIPKAEELKEVVVLNKKHVFKTIGFLKNKSKFSWQIGSKHEFISVIKPNKIYENAFLEKIHFPIKQSIFNDSLMNKTGVLRINIYSIKNNIPDKKIFSSIPISYSMDVNADVELNISNNLIRFVKEGICIGIENIGIIDNNGEIISNKRSSQLNLYFTSKASKDFDSIKTYTNSVFSDYDKLILVNDFLKNNTILKKEQYLIFGLTVSINK